jgi:uncharacterized membrane protein YhaH (DUF805 family)
MTMEHSDGMGLMGILFGIAFLALLIWIFARISRKAGFSGWWSLLMFVPLVNIVLVWVFAFVNWPAETSKEKIAGVFE